MPREPTPRAPAGRWFAAMLAVAVNLLLIAFLVFSVTWQNRRPETVSVELYAPPSPAPAKAEAAPPREILKPPPEPPQAPPEPPKPPPEPPKPQPEPPKPEPPKPAPKVEPPAPTKADIAIKAKQEQAERERKEKERREVEKREAEKREAEKREAEKREAEKKKQEEKRLAEVRERQAREEAALKAQAERERVQVAAAAQAAAQDKAINDYIRRIQAKIKGNVIVPPDITGNPEAIFDVVQLPTGEIIDIQLRKSSGVRMYDEAVQRAIIKASPLPRPDSPDLFRRNLTLKFRPLD